MKNIFKTKVRWFKYEPVIKQYEWTHIYMNSLNKPVHCIVIEDVATEKSQGRPYTVLNENGVTAYLLENDLITITQYNRMVNGLSTK
jgi:hypothetical protein